MDLDVQLGQHVLLVHGSVRNVTDGSRLDHVSDGESLNGLVLGDHAGTVGASHRLDVSSALLVASVRGSLLRHVVLKFVTGKGVWI